MEKHKMFKNESDFKKLIDRLDIDTEPNPNHRENLRREMLSVFNETRPSQQVDPVAAGARRAVTTTILQSRIAKVAAAVIAAALLVPLAYGTAAIINRLFLGTVEVDSFKTQFELGRDMRLELQVGTKQQRKIVTAGSIRFFKEGEEVLGTLRYRIRPWPKFKWRTNVELLNAKGLVLASTEHVRENSGVKPVRPDDWFGLSIHCSLGPWHKASQVQTVRVGFERVTEEAETTADAWVESTQLPVVHGRVTSSDGQPIVDAEVQIRERRKPGQLSIAAPDVHTGKQGYYSFDAIEWPYRVGVLVYEQTPSGQGYRFQYLRSNKVLEGTQAVDFSFGRFPQGTAVLSGQATEPNGAVIKKFTLDVRLKVDWKDYSTQYLYQFGIRKPFTTPDGRFEVTDLAPGIYDVSVMPTIKDSLTVNEGMRIRNYICTLVNGETSTIKTENAMEKVWYGRVLFDDGTPAVLDSPAVRANIIKWEKGFPEGYPIATVDDDGYFAALLSDEIMARLNNGQAWLTITVSHPICSSNIQKDKFPAELLFLQRDKAQVVRVTRPRTYYGQVSYENGKPAVPEVIPWPGAKVWVQLRYTPATATDGGLAEDLGDIDSQGYFAVYLTDEQLEQIKAGQYHIEIYHPSYEEKNYSYRIGRFPYEILATEPSQAKIYKLPYENMSVEFKNLKQQLESVEKLKDLASVLFAYCADHADNFPISLEELRAYDVNGLLIWAKENVEYLGSGHIRTAHEAKEIASAYDKALLKKTNGTGTMVLFLDGHIEFCRPKQLQILGIEGLEK